MSVDFLAIRNALGAALTEALPAVNVYAHAEPQPEYPALLFGPIEGVEYHVAHCIEGVAFTWGAQVLVANPDTESAVRNLEALLSGDTSVVNAIEAVKAPDGEWSNLVVDEARDFQALQSLDGFGCSLVITVHV